jgi:hypothetical protein
VPRAGWPTCSGHQRTSGRQRGRWDPSLAGPTRSSATAESGPAWRCPDRRGQPPQTPVWPCWPALWKWVGNRPVHCGWTTASRLSCARLILAPKLQVRRLALTLGRVTSWARWPWDFHYPYLVDLLALAGSGGMEPEVCGGRWVNLLPPRSDGDMTGAHSVMAPALLHSNDSSSPRRAYCFHLAGSYPFLDPSDPHVDTRDDWSGSAVFRPPASHLSLSVIQSGRRHCHRLHYLCRLLWQCRRIRLKRLQFLTCQGCLQRLTQPLGLQREPPASPISA